jgi:predicted AAA+ superfamily ATPase
VDRPAEAAVVAADPDVALAGFEEPVLIDEWQVVPDVLGAVKRAVDDDPRPGRFLLTGSVRAELASSGWPATGRVVRLPLWGLCQREVAGAVEGASPLDILFDGAVEELAPPVEELNLRHYVDLALRGGFPEVALQTREPLRRRWLASYIDQVVQRDAALAGESRDPQRLRRYLRAVAANSAGVVEHKTLYDAAAINRLTAMAYDNLLEALFVTEQVPAWTTNRLARVTRTAKRYLVEPALLGPLAGMDARSVLRDVDQLGRLVDTFVVSQLRAELSVSELGITMHHLRQEHGRREVDLVLEAADGRVVAVEIKATAAPTAEMARHLIWLRDELGDNLVAGVVLHTGPRPFRIDDRIHALPISSLWASHDRR